jgi:hypothetical protein
MKVVKRKVVWDSKMKAEEKEKYFEAGESDVVFDDAKAEFLFKKGYCIVCVSVYPRSNFVIVGCENGLIGVIDHKKKRMVCYITYFFKRDAGVKITSINHLPSEPNKYFIVSTLEGCVYYGRISEGAQADKNPNEMMVDRMKFVDYMMQEKPVVKEGTLKQELYPSRVSAYLKGFEKNVEKKKEDFSPQKCADVYEKCIKERKFNTEMLENYVREIREDENNNNGPKNRVGNSQIFTMKIDPSGRAIVMGGVSGVGNYFLKK